MANQTTQAEALLPHNIEAEESLLGALLIDPDAIVKVAPIIEAKDFFVTRNGWIYEAVLDLAERGEPSDLVVLSDELDRRNKLYELGGQARLTELINATTTSIHAESFARIIDRTAKLRRLIEAASQIAVMAYEDASDVDEIYGVALGLIEGSRGKSSHEKTKRLNQVMEVVYDTMDWQLSNKESYLGVPTGIADFDKAMNKGFSNSELVTVASGPGGGKSALAATIAYNLGNMGKRVIYFNYEMSDLQIGQRLVSMDSGINSALISMAEIPDEEFPLFLRSLNQLNQVEVYIVDAAGMTVRDIKSEVMRIQAEHGNVDLVIVDYIQLVSPNRGERFNNRAEAVNGTTRELKLMAKSLCKPVLALSQISREPSKRINKRPVLSDLSDSSGIEKDSDRVVFIYRDDMTNEDSEEPNVAEFITAKFRTGATGTVKTFFKKTTTQFLDLETKRQQLDY